MELHGAPLRPRLEILDGSWKVPLAAPQKLKLEFLRHAASAW